MSKKILLLSAHFGEQRFGHALADAYQQAASENGAEIKRFDLKKMQFDPVLRDGDHGGDQLIEDDIKTFQQALEWCDHWVMVYPMWWGGMPAVLRGLLDRALLPGFAFRYVKGKPLPAKLLKGRSARVMITSDTPGWFYKWFYGAGHSKTVKGQILDFVGFQKSKITMFGSLKRSSASARTGWIEKARSFGMKDAVA